MTRPTRIQRKRTKVPKNTVILDRASGFGTPFPVRKCKMTRMGVAEISWSVGTWEGPALWFCNTKDEAMQLAVNAYQTWIGQPQQSALREKVRALRGKNLACFCALYQPCHADVLLDLANAP